MKSIKVLYKPRLELLLQALQEDNVKVMTINPAQVSTPMTWSRPDSEYIPDLMIQPKEVADMCVFAFKVMMRHHV